MNVQKFVTQLILHLNSPKIVQPRSILFEYLNIFQRNFIINERICVALHFLPQYSCQLTILKRIKKLVCATNEYECAKHKTTRTAK